MRKTALLGEKNTGIFEIYGVFSQTRREGGWTSADIFRTRGRGNFSRFCADVFYGCP